MFSTDGKDRFNLTGVKSMSDGDTRDLEGHELDAVALFFSENSKDNQIKKLEEKLKSEYQRGVAVAAQEVMNEMVDYAKEVIRLKDQIGELETKYYTVMQDSLEMAVRAKAWDDLEALISTKYDVNFNLEDDQYALFRFDRFIGSSADLKEAVSNALESIKNG